MKKESLRNTNHQLIIQSKASNELTFVQFVCVFFTLCLNISDGFSMSYICEQLVG